MIQLAEEINVVSATDGDASLENESTIGKQEKKEKGKRKKEKKTPTAFRGKVF